MNNKYRARRTQGTQGIWFRSKLEANYAQELELRRHAEDERERVDWWVYEVTFYLPTILYRPGMKQRQLRHIVDFLVGWADGRVCLVEVKGKETPTGKVKRLWLENYVGPIRVVERLGQ